jgi:hypothetical protein
MSRWLKSLLPDAGRAVGYGPLVPGLRDFYILALERCSWLVVHAPDEETVQIVAEQASRAGARSVTRYRLPATAPLAATASVAGAAPRGIVVCRDAGADALALS